MFDDWELISAYTRAQAIDDGLLIDLTDATDRDGRKLSPFRWPVAITVEAYHAAIAAGGHYEPDENGGERLVLPGCQDFAGRVWDVFWLLVCAIRSHPTTDTVPFEVSVLVDGQTKRETLKLKSLVGPGDDGEPVLTIMLPHED